MIEVKRGLDLPVAGVPARQIDRGSRVEHVAVLGVDYLGMKPTMAVREGDRVAAGQPLFTDKKTAGVNYCAPAAGEVVAIHRGERRRLLSVVIQVDNNADDRPALFEPLGRRALADLERSRIVERLNQVGLWAALRTRPFSRVPALDAEPADIFVTAMDTHPLSGDPALVIDERRDDFVNGLAVLEQLTRGRVQVCHAPGADVPGGELERVRLESFSGPHPAGLAGTHIHHLSPVGLARQVWHLGYQDVIAIGVLFSEGRLDNERVIAVGGPRARQPRMVRSRLGASLDELLQGEIDTAEDTRVISGSVFGGRTARGPLAWLGRFHNQVSLIEEGDKHRLLGWLSPGRKRHSVLGIYMSRFIKPAEYRPTTNTNGSERAMVPVGSYETVMPLDILPTQLLRSLIVGDIETAMALGCLELDEEDLALCTYVCPGKYEYGPILRDNLTTIEKEV